MLRFHWITALKTNNGDALIAALAKNLALLEKYHIETLLNSADGKGLRYNCTSIINSWISNTSKLLSGKYYVGDFKLKHSLLHTKFRAKRMFASIMSASIRFFESYFANLHL